MMLHKNIFKYLKLISRDNMEAKKFSKDKHSSSSDEYLTEEHVSRFK